MKGNRTIFESMGERKRKRREEGENMGSDNVIEILACYMSTDLDISTIEIFARVNFNDLNLFFQKNLKK